MTPQEFQSKVVSREATVAIVGLGYVGLPLALTFVEKGFSVLGFDIDQSKVDQLNAGSSFIGHIAASRIRAAVDSSA